VAEILQHWEKWNSALKIYILGKKKGYLTLFMDRAVENTIDEIWPESPSKGFKLQALAQTMITSALQDLIPSIGRDQCAPVPRPNKILKRSLARIGLELSNQGTLNYKYSTLTFYPYKNGCEVCYLSTTCPKLNLPRMEGLFNPPE